MIKKMKDRERERWSEEVVPLVVVPVGGQRARMQSQEVNQKVVIEMVQCSKPHPSLPNEKRKSTES